MEKFFDYFEMIFVTIWNALYDYLCKIMGEEVNEDWYIDSLNPNED